jgi:phospholipid-binding lipoprotein MlaA
MKLIKFFFFLIIITIFNLGIQAEENSEGTYQYTYRIDDNGSTCSDVYDPYEKLNRRIFAFNSVLDHFILRPIAVGYQKVTNDYVKARVGSFIDNINVPLTTVNYGLQANFDKGIKSLWRFIINTTFGLGGLFDIASKVDLNPPPQTFGNTLAHFGVGPGPYLVVPFFGGTNTRNVTDSLFSNNALNPIKYPMHKDFLLVLAGTKIVHERTMLLPFTDYVAKNSTDPYIAIRSAIHQNRESKVNYPKGFICPQINTSLNNR